MNKEDQILASIEELASQLSDLQKQKSSSNSESENLISKKLIEIENSIKSNSQLVNSHKSEIIRHFNESKTCKPEDAFQETIKHQYIEIKHAKKWFTGFLCYFFLSIGLIVLLINQNKHTGDYLLSTQANDIKYRFLKVYNEPLANFKEVAFNTTDLVNYIDANYNSDPTEFHAYVVNREGKIRMALEAEEIAKQKEAEAKAAQKNAQRLKDNIK